MPSKIIEALSSHLDKAKDIMEKYVHKHHLESLVTLIHNEKRVGALENHYNAIYNYIPDHKVVVIVDGDDTLSHNGVLLQLEKNMLIQISG